MHYYIAASDHNRQMGVVVLAVHFKRKCGATAELWHAEDATVSYSQLSDIQTAG